ncbi:NERD domain-containing protein [Mycoplasma struthionis]|uniref:NERD domain-containing protein n=1 Tax=Mycoplasma struthionis TaxID=538220 RepID=A0A3G8LHS5_9MOLU|nr:NERD domain-containing protein [Mycoplasma struthionis]AZG68914.1 hypothetical protein EGN60_03120 [Mycoplasma struthionis]TPI01156.1 hypothetical protein FJM01_03000 [Mycoplasma struthionis]
MKEIVNVANKQVVENKELSTKFIIGMVVGVILFFVVISLFCIFIKLMMRRHKKNQEQIFEYDKKIESELIHLTNVIPDAKLIKDYVFLKNKQKFNINFIFLSKSVVFVLEKIYYESGTLEVDWTNREWLLKQENKNMIIPNPTINLDMNIKAVRDILPSNLPIYGIVIYKDNVKIEMLNNQNYILYSSLNSLSDTIYEQNKQLFEVLNQEEIKFILKDLKLRRAQ